MNKGFTMTIKKFKNVPKKIYVCDSAQHEVNQFQYYGTDMEEPTAPYVTCNYHIFIKDMGKPTVEKIEFDTLCFEMDLNDRDIFTTKRGCERYKKQKIKESIKRIEQKILELENEKVQLEAL